MRPPRRRHKLRGERWQQKLPQLQAALSGGDGVDADGVGALSEAGRFDFDALVAVLE